MTLKNLLAVLSDNIKWDLMIDGSLVLTGDEYYLNSTIKYIEKDGDMLKIYLEK